MTRLVSNNINSLVQVVDSNGDKVTDAVVNYKVYFYDEEDTERWIVASSGLMTHIGDGLYQAEWTPNTVGEYTFFAYCSNPKFNESYTYNIEGGRWQCMQTGGCASMEATGEGTILEFVADPQIDDISRHYIVELDVSSISSEKFIIRAYKANANNDWKLFSKKTYPTDFDSNEIHLIVIDLGWLNYTGASVAKITMESTEVGGESGPPFAAPNCKVFVGDT